MTRSLSTGMRRPAPHRKGTPATQPLDDAPSSWDLGVIRAVQRRADEDAELLCMALKAAGVTQGVSVRQALDLVAQLRFDLWENSGIGSVIRSERERLEPLAEKCVATRQASAISAKFLGYFALWFECFAWGAPKALGVDVAAVTGRPLQDTQVDQLARVLWRAYRTRRTSTPNPSDGGETHDPTSN